MSIPKLASDSSSGGVGLLAFRAEDPDEPLGDDRDHRRGDEKRLDPHIDEARHGARRVVRVEGGEDKVAGERRLDRDLRRLPVADFADKDDVRVLADDGAKPLGEGQVDLRVDLDLTDAVDLVLDRVLDRDDVHLGLVDARQRRIEGRRLAAPRRPRDEDDPVGDLISRLKMPTFRSSIPRSESIRIDEVLSRSRSTTRSPKAVGMVETRMSTLRSATLISIRPSWGGASRRCSVSP